jgi:hypothetical protein
VTVEPLEARQTTQRVEPVIEDRNLHRHEYLYLRRGRECRPAGRPRPGARHQPRRRDCAPSRREKHIRRSDNAASRTRRGGRSRQARAAPFTREGDAERDRAPLCRRLTPADVPPIHRMHWSSAAAPLLVVHGGYQISRRAGWRSSRQSRRRGPHFRRGARRDVRLPTGSRG